MMFQWQELTKSNEEQNEWECGKIEAENGKIN